MKKKLLVAVTGSVAVIKIEKLITLLKNDFDVKVIASDYVLKNYPDIKNVNPEYENPDLMSFPEHIKLSKWADQILVAPATANTIAKFYSGIADNPLLSTLLAARQKIIFAPAMNTYMYEALIQRGIIDELAHVGHMFIGPNWGKLREGESGLGRMSEPEEIHEIMKNFFLPNKQKVIISYGASKLYIDDVRFISNDSTGTMGKFLINTLRLKGFDVSSIDVSKYTNNEVLNYLQSKDFDIYISTAALADFDISQVKGKIKKSEIENINLSFKQNIDILKEIKKTHPMKKYVGFKYDNDKQNAVKKMDDLQLDLMVWNKIGSMGSKYISGEILGMKNIKFEDASKKDVAIKITEVLNENK